MLDSILISNFKAIGKTPLELKNLSKVNYLVGKNGCGKSSVLDYLNEKNKETVSIYLDCLDLNHNSNNFGEILPQSSEIFQQSTKFDEKERDFKESIFIKINKILNGNGFLDLKDGKAERFSEYEEENGEKVVIGRQLKITGIYGKNEEASGFWVLRNLIYQLLFILKTRFKDGILTKDHIYKGGGEVNLNNQIRSLPSMNEVMYHNPKKDVVKSYPIILDILIDEPETSLNPGYQKLLPKLLEFIRLELCKETEYFKPYFGHTHRFDFSKSIRFFIATHSPFIISAAGEFADSQKVYMIENGICTNPEGNSGSEVKEVVNTMLGVENTDFLPANIVFCDQSLEVFLKLIYKEFYFNIKEISFRVPKHPLNNENLGGDSSLLSLVSVQDLLLQGQGVLMTNFFIIMDKVKDEPKSEKDFRKQEALKNKYKNLIILETFSFEAKFEQDPKNLKGAKEKVKNAKIQAEKLIKKGENGKVEFERLFAELSPIFGFDK